MSLSILFDFMQGLNSIRKHPTKIEYFSKHILFTTIYLLKKQKLNPNKYSEQEINMSNFVKATKHDVHMYERLEILIFIYN
jgi:hypothetical protein